MKLFLSGGGSEFDSLELDKEFASSLDKSKTLLYIPIAINKIKHPFPVCLKWLSHAFNPLGVTKIELWTEKDLLEKPESELQRFSGVYIGGGNTFYLLDVLRETNFLPKLLKLIESGVPVYGGSAGALILSKSIVTAKDENKIGMTDFSALNKIYGFSLVVHFRQSLNLWVFDLMKKFSFNKLIALPQDCGLIVDNSSIKVVGPGSAFLFSVDSSEIKEFKPGQLIK